MIEKKQLTGLDIWKFTMAVLIVALHTQFLKETTVYEYLHLFEDMAVPCFMAISAYFFFHKIYSLPANENSRPYLWHTVKRLVILFAAWSILVLPMTYMRFYSIASLKEIVFAWCLTQTAQGYWFIKALLYNTILFYFCRKMIPLIILSLIGLTLYIYFAYNYIYHFDSFALELHPYYTFFYNMAYFAAGVWLAKYPQVIEKCKGNKLVVMFGVWLILYSAACHNELIAPVYKLMSFSLLFPIFYHQSLGEGSPSLCKTLRNMSIILYMSQFVLIWIYDLVCTFVISPDNDLLVILQHSVTRFFTVLTCSVIIAGIILKNEDKKYFAFLKYLH